MRRKVFFVITVLLAAALLSGCAGGAVRGLTWSGLAADDSAAYLADGPHVFAVNLKDGKELWRYPAGNDRKLVFYAAPVVTSDGLVIVGSAGTGHSLIALNSKDVRANENNINSPSVAWTFDGAKDHWVAPPLVVGDKLFAVNADGYLYVLDLQDGQSSKRAVKAVQIDGRLWAQPTTDGQRVFITCLDHKVVAVDVETYEVLWNDDTEAAITGSAVPAPDGMLYMGSFASQLYKIDPASGNREPVLEAKNWIWSTPSLDGDTLYFGDLNGWVYSFNTATGKSNWSPVQPNGSITGSPLIQGERILVATESGAVYALDRSGKVVWSQQVGGKIYTTPVAAGDLILVAPLEAEFYLAALDENGRQVWTFAPES